jgi:dTDP-4-dehydrorhamnose reductase
MEAEELVLGKPHNLVLRLSAVYGHNPANRKFSDIFFEKSGAPKKVINGSKESVFCPTYLEDIAENFPRIMELSGVLHFSGEQPMTEYDFLSKLAAQISPKTVVKEAPFYAKYDSPPRPRRCSIFTERNIAMKRTSFENALKEMRPRCPYCYS